MPNYKGQEDKNAEDRLEEKIQNVLRLGMKNKKCHQTARETFTVKYEK